MPSMLKAAPVAALLVMLTGCASESSSTDAGAPSSAAAAGAIKGATAVLPAPTKFFRARSKARGISMTAAETSSVSTTRP